MLNWEDAGMWFMLEDGRRMTTRDLFVEAVRLDERCGDAYATLMLGALPECAKAGCRIDTRRHACMDDGGVLTQRELGLRFVRCAKNRSSTRIAREELVESGGGRHMRWRRMEHDVLWGRGTNALFGALLLGLGRLVATGVVARADPDMVDELLEEFTFDDDDLI